MSNRQLIQHFIEADTKPGMTVHKFIGRSSIPKHTLEALEKNKVMKRALQNLNGKTFLKHAQTAGRELMREGHLHHARAEFGTATRYVKHIYTAEARKAENIKEQNIKDLQAARDKEQPKAKTAPGQSNSAGAGIGRVFTGAVSAFTYQKQVDKEINQVPGQPRRKARRADQSEADDAGNDSSGNNNKNSETNLVDSVYGDTNLKPKDQLPKPIQKPAGWAEAERKVEEEAMPLD